MDNTYLKLFRKMLTWEWYKDTNTVRVFLHILLKANYSPSRYMGHDIGAGECVFGYEAWAEQLGLSVQNVKTAIKHLKSTQEITTKVTNRFTIIHVEKWEFWQLYDGEANKQANKQLTSNQQATNKQLTASKESKKVIIKESKNIYTDMPDELISALKDFEDMRKRIKSPLSDRARQMLLSKLDKLAGDDTEKKIAILEQSIFNSWKGVYDIDDRRSDQKCSRISGTAGTGTSGNQGTRTKLPPVEESLLKDFGSESNA